jgi:hypothetical protein
MRNLRKTRKKGGIQFVDNVFMCTPAAPGTPSYVAVDNCAQEFATAQGFQIIDTADDGNCFYDSLSKYGQRTGNPATNKSHMEIRRAVVGFMIANQARYAPYLIPDDPAAPVPTPAQITARLRQYLKSRTWAGGLGDVFPQVAAEVLNLNITIYDVQDDGSVRMISMGTGPDGGPNPALPTVHLVRTNGNHFRLLWPAAAAAAAPGPAPGPARAPSPPKARAPSPPKARAPSPPKARAPSPPKARAPTPPRPVSPPKPAAAPARTTARRRPIVAPNAVNKLGQNVKAMGIGNAAPQRMTARQKSLKALANARAAAAAAPAVVNKPKRQSRRKPVKPSNQEALNLQAALLESAAAAKKNKKNNSNSNNEILRKVMEMSITNV